MIKKILIIVAVIFALSYFGFIKINSGRVKNAVKQINTAENRAKVKNTVSNVVKHAKEIVIETE